MFYLIAGLIENTYATTTIRYIHIIMPPNGASGLAGVTITGALKKEIVSSR